MSTRLRVCIDARHAISKVGGTATFTLSLARALLGLEDGTEQYFFLVRAGDGQSLEQGLRQSVNLIESPCDPGPLRRLASRIPGGRSTLHRVRLVIDRLGGSVRPAVARSDGMVERAGINVVHFTAQDGFLTDIPSIYQPHDLQHRHLPQFFTPRERATREYRYATLCERAAIVCVVSQWGKRDLLESYHLPPARVRVVHYAPDGSLSSRPSAELARAIAHKYKLPGKFLFYPARTWPHKNHLRLLQALQLLRERDGLIIPLVCSGELTSFYYSELRAECMASKLSEQVRFLGFVEFNDLRPLYQLCSGVIIPTLFEAGSFPLWEAFLNQKPAACSNVTSLPAQAGDAAVIFDPYSVAGIADAAMRLWIDQELCATLVQRGSLNVSRFSWDTTARTYRALYRQLGKRPLTAADEQLLSSSPLL